jgi:endonuclease/exonuclease/phosphatase family metal-dependent hydrolase
MKKVLKTMGLLILAAAIAFGIFIYYAIGPGISESKLPRSAVLKFGESAAAVAKPSKLTVVSYNIGYGSGLKNNQEPVTEAEHQANLEKMASDLQSLKPDLVFLQEVDFRSRRSFNIDQMKFLAEKLGLGHGAYVLTWNKNYVAWPYWPPARHFGKVVSGQAVLSRYPIQSQQLIEFPKPANNAFWYNWFYLDRIVQHLILDLPGEQVSVYNIHLEAFSADTREEQITQLGRLIKADPFEAKIAAGDFNLADPILGDKEDSDRDTKGLLKAFAATTGMKAIQGEKPYYSMPSSDPYKLIDHIFYSPRFRLEKAGNILNSTASDHLAVWTNLGF